MFVKICGITNKEDAQTAVRCGVSAVGLVFCPSPRRINLEKARAVRKVLPAHVAAVGVFTEQPVSLIREVAAYCGLDLVQFHGGQSPDTCRALEWPCIRAFRIRDETSLHAIRCFEGTIHAVLLDAWDQERAGGIGRAFDWDLLPPAGVPAVPVILAGGLTPDNVARAVARVRPFGVDASSGVEERPGVKDPLLVERFVDQARLWRPREVIHA